MESAHISSITAKSDVTLLRIQLAEGNATKTIAAGLRILWDLGVAPLASMHTQQGKTSIWQLVVVSGCAEGFAEQLAATQNLSHDAIEVACDQMSCVSIVGAGFQQSPEIMDAVAGIVPAPKLLTHRDTAISICVPRANADRTVEALHRTLIAP